MFGEEIKVMIATRVAGQGVSLMNTRQVHILEPHWNEAKIKQAIGRAQRIGRTSKLNVHYLKHNNE